jgi:integrase
MGKPRVKPNYRRRVLRLPDLDHCKTAVLNSLGSPASRRVYEYAIDQFIAWYCSEPRLAFNRIVVVRYRMYLESRHLAANTINQQLAAVRRLAHEAADAGLLSPELAAGISRVKGVKQLGFRSGNWLSVEQSSEVLKHAGGDTMRAKILGLMWMDLDFSDQVIEVKRAYVWAQFKVPKSKASKAPVPMHSVLAGFLMAWRERTPYAKDDDYVFPSFRLKGKKPLSASIMVQKYLRPAAVKAGVIKEDQRVRFGFHNFRHSLASSLVKLKCDPKTVQGILRHEDVRTTMQLYAQSDQESRLEAQGKFLALLLGDKAHLLTEAIH